MRDNSYLERQSRTPLFDAVMNYAKERKISFHTPGHKHGDGIAKRFRDFIGPKVFDMDLTLLEELDSLHEPRGVIKEAQELAAQVYEADFTFFLVNGTTIGNHTMVLSCCNAGDKIIIPRNAHTSVFAGIILSGAVPVYIQPIIDHNLNLVVNVTPQQIEKALSEHPDAKAVLITNPTYNGIATDIKRIADIVHEHGKVLLVDEAHGPHLHFNEAFPISAISAGADMCVQSTHKIIGGMTQASMMHVKSTRVDVSRVKKTLQLLQTTSPSYILMSSLDVARMQIATEGKELLSKVIQIAENTRENINKIDGLTCFGREVIGNPGIYDIDVTKLTISTCNAGIPAYEVAHLLNREHKIQVEFADPINLLALVSFGNSQNDMDALVEGLRNVTRKLATGTLFSENETRLPAFSSAVMTPREAVFSESKYVSLKNAWDQICAEIISPCPPGVPVLVPGEKINKEIYEYLIKLTEGKGKNKNQYGNGFENIKILELGGRNL